MAAETRWFKSPYVGVVSFLSHPFQRISFKSRTSASVPATTIPFYQFYYWYLACVSWEGRKAVRTKARRGKGERERERKRERERARERERERERAREREREREIETTRESARESEGERVCERESTQKN